MVLTIAAIIAILWLLGFIGHIGGGLIHLVLVIAIVVALYDLLVTRRRKV